MGRDASLTDDDDGNASNLFSIPKKIDESLERIDGNMIITGTPVF